MCLMQHIHKVTVQIAEQSSRDRHIQAAVKHLRWRVLQKARHFFDFQKEQGQPLLSSLVQHKKVWLNLGLLLNLFLCRTDILVL